MGFLYTIQGEVMAIRGRGDENVKDLKEHECLAHLSIALRGSNRKCSHTSFLLPNQDNNQVNKATEMLLITLRDPDNSSATPNTTSTTFTMEGLLKLVKSYQPNIQEAPSAQFRCPEFNEAVSGSSTHNSGAPVLTAYSASALQNRDNEQPPAADKHSPAM